MCLTSLELCKQGENVILELYILFIVIALTIIAVGLFSTEQVYAILGLCFLFYLGFILNAGTLQIQTSTNISTTTINSTDYSIVTPIYTYYNDNVSNWFGRYMMIGSGLGLVAVISSLAGFKFKKRDNENEP